MILKLANEFVVIKIKLQTLKHHQTIMEDFYMSTRSKLLSLMLSLTFGIFSVSSFAGLSTDSVTLYTPYTKISVPPGESIDYTIDLINYSKKLKNADISLSGIPKGWTYSLKSGGWTIGQISILPGERKSLNLKVEVPLKVNKGSYRFSLVAGGFEPLPLCVVVSEQGTFKTEFTTDQPNMQGNASSTFTFNANLKNRTADKQLYALMVDAPRGWNVTFKSNYQPVTSVNIEANSTQTISIEIKPPDKIEAGKYKIPVSAATSTTSAYLELEAVVTGSYSMELTTPSGLVSTKITAGDTKRIELRIINTGSSELKDVTLDFSAPLNWDITFDPKKIDKILPGRDAQVFAAIKADKKAIAGDYVANINAKTPEVSSKILFRISVETPLLWGWIGVFIILAALYCVYYLFRKYGRR
jgi:uncharacterized membrane protein